MAGTMTPLKKAAGSKQTPPTRRAVGAAQGKATGAGLPSTAWLTTPQMQDSELQDDLQCRAKVML